jgi:hypothetical protein
MKIIYILWLVMPSGEQYQWAQHDNVHACAGNAARERHAQVQVQQKTGVDLDMRFICKVKT